MSTPPTETAIGDADGSPNYDWQLYHESRDTFAGFAADDLRKILKQELQIEVRNAARHTLEIVANGKKTLTPAEEAAVADMAAKLAAEPSAPEPQTQPATEVPTFTFSTFGEAAEAAAAHIAEAFTGLFTPEALARLRADIARAERKRRRRLAALRTIMLLADLVLVGFNIAQAITDHPAAWQVTDCVTACIFAAAAVYDFRAIRKVLSR